MKIDVKERGCAEDNSIELLRTWYNSENLM
jgi:hypothetical protein